MNQSKMSSRELLASTLSKMVAEGKSIKQSDHTWLLSNVDIGNGSSDYIIKAMPKLGKSGKTFIKRELVRLDGSTEKSIELGEFKKKYLYPMVKTLTKPIKIRKKLYQCPWNELKQIIPYIKDHYSEFSFDDKGSLIGNIPAIANFPAGSMEITAGFVKHMKNNHNRNFGRQMFIDGKLFYEGAGLDCHVAIYNKMMAKHSN